MSDRGHQRDPEKGWQRDAAGRLFRTEAGSRVFRNTHDRDEALEEPYTERPCTRACCGSILASVDRHHDMLVAEYMRWCYERCVRESFDTEALAQWERERFGARLEVAAHGILLYAVRVARFGERKAAPKQPRLQDGLTDDERLRRMQVALSQLADAKTMPDQPSAAEWDARRQEQVASFREAGEEG